jgi:glycosyltransferase involved in cell wall biosynthesis
MWAYTAARYTDRHKKKLFYSLHYHPDGLGMSKWHTLIVHMLNRLPMKRARRLYHLTRIDFDLFAREYRNTDRSLFFALPNGVNPPLAVRSAGRNNDELKLLFVGRVEDVRKGFDILELAYARVRQSNWTLTVIGRISQEKRSALEAKFGSAIRVLGDVDEETLEHEYAESDLFVMPSRYEGFGMPYIEAMRYETPVIGTTAGGIPEVVPEGTGILVAPEDEDAHAEAMTYLGTSSALRKAFGAEGKLWADRFQWRFIIDQLESDYNEA